ncbi:MAG: GNAT family N-acetyltransferase [Parvibaculum sp.]|uniref:GNAT family N-acetyltransferase n=1 Tax=Parvibaculum sp. TaxID=2024848 RepID=UPI0025D8BCA7|nr:GNAT family N-acetyltransferase [Parvibaculum sp.]MCE9650212.1 GNAT family N-acetyltransferase [Parvibaculum sp.]
MPPATLKTERLILRPWRADDFDAFAAMSADPEVMEFLMAPVDRTASDANAERLKAHIETHGFGFWALEIPGVAPFIGFTGLIHVSFDAPFVPAVEIGWRLARAHWGKGYAVEAAKASLEHGFGPLGLEEIVALTVPANIRSQQVMRRIGMTRNEADDFDHPRVPEGHPLKRHVLYRVKRDVIRP